MDRRNLRTREQPALRSSLSYATPPSLIHHLDLLDYLALDERHLVIFGRLLARHNKRHNNADSIQHNISSTERRRAHLILIKHDRDNSLSTSTSACMSRHWLWFRFWLGLVNRHLRHLCRQNHERVISNLPHEKKYTVGINLLAQQAAVGEEAEAVEVEVELPTPARAPPPLVETQEA